MEKVMERSCLVLENGERTELEYFLVTQEEMGERVKIYGIGIQKLPEQRKEGIYREREVVESLTESEEKARNWLGKLARNQVTPMCLVEILDELVTREGI